MMRKILVCLLALGLLAGCGQVTQSGSAAGNTAVSAAPAGVYAPEDSDASTEGAVALQSGETITKAGTYLLSGSFGQVVVDAGKDDLVRLVLSGAQLSSTDSAPVYIKQAKKVVLILADGTQNTVTDNADAPSGEDDPTGAIYSKADLSITGKGSLTVNANHQHGIVSKDALVVTDGVVQITSASDALRGCDSVSVSGGTFTLNAGSDGIQSNNDEDAAKGWIALDGGSFAITAARDGVQAETALTVTGGVYQIETNGGAENGASHGGFARGQTQQADTESYKGFKAGGTLTVTGGELTLDTADDALHASAVTVAGGKLTIETGDDGVHADAALTVSGGDIKITKSYEGLEGLSIDITGGTVALTASDDGLNAAGGNDSSGGDMFAVTEGAYIRISGGTVTVDAAGDGVDSNGDLFIDGGTVTVNGPTNDGNGALDYNGVCKVTAGTLIAAGSSGMAQAPGTDSTAPTLSVTWSDAQSAAVTVKDAGGSAVLTASPTKNYQNIVFASDTLKKGETYTLYSGSDKLCEVTLTDTVTKISSDGTAYTGGGMGGGGKRGMNGGKGQRPTGGQNGTPPTDGSAPTPPTDGAPSTDGSVPNGGTRPERPDATSGATPNT